MEQVAYKEQAPMPSSITRNAEEKAPAMTEPVSETAMGDDASTQQQQAEQLSDGPEAGAS